MNRRTDDASRPGDRHRPSDAEALTAVEHRLQETLKQEAQYWERREPARLRSTCRVPLATSVHHADTHSRRLWVGALTATVICAFVVFGRYSWWTSFPAPEPPVVVVSVGRQVAKVVPCTDVMDLYARLPSCPPLPRPPPLVPPPPPNRPVINRP